MPELKPITLAGVRAALQKAERYRLLNEPAAAESICLDVLAIDQDNAEALTTLVLALTDQFDEQRVRDRQRATDTVARLTDPYAQAYYNGIVCERWGKALLRSRPPGVGARAWSWIAQAMNWYARAEQIRPVGDDDPILRWNSCVRLLESEPDLKPVPQEAWEPSLEQG